MKTVFSISSAVILFTAMLSGLGCKKSNDPMFNSPASLSVDSAVSQTTFRVSLKVDSALGQYLVDKGGRTLYIFGNDPNGKDKCTGQCQLYWPAFSDTSLTAARVGPGLDFADFGLTTSSAGKPQVTYKGWPLYYFAPDGINVEAPGKIQGDNVGNIWFVAKPDYSIMIVNAQLLGVDSVKYKSDYTPGIGTTTYFTDAYGRTLYNFSHDSANQNHFTVPDTATVNNYNKIWPIYETNKIVVPSALDKTKFGSITVFGHKQLTYKRWPMYFFYLDKRRGSNKGVAFPQAPNPPQSPVIWPVVTQNQSGAPHS